ncbi:hypothetical protein BH09BAC5_BH09BAC5_26590 [soil metagenome]
MNIQQSFVLAIIFELSTCGSSAKMPVEAKKTVESKTNIYSNIIQVKQYGDSIRIEVERRGDTLIKHYIDLKGTDDDNFDNSFNAVCTYKKIKNDTTIKSSFYITEGDYQIYFYSTDVISYCDSIIKQMSTSYDNDVTKPYYENLKKRALKKTDILYLNQESELIQNFKCYFINTKTKEKPKSILIEFYRTEFSGGKYYYIINQKGDTINLFHQLDFIN